MPVLNEEAWLVVILSSPISIVWIELVSKLTQV